MADAANRDTPDGVGLEAAVRAQDWARAAQRAVALERHLDAASYFVLARMPYEAAVCYQKAGAQRECLFALMQVPAASPRYRSACVHAVRVASALGSPLTGLAGLVTQFVGTLPTSRAEATACCQLAAAFAATNPHLARSIYGLVFLAFPDDAEAKEGLDSLGPPASPASALAGQPPLAGQATPRPFSAPPTGRTPAPFATPAGLRQPTPVPFGTPASLSPMTPRPFAPPQPGATPAPFAAPAAPRQATPRPFSPSPDRQATPLPFAPPAPDLAGRPSRPGQGTPLPFSPKPASLDGRTHRLRDLLLERGLVPRGQLERLLAEKPETSASDVKLADAVVATGLVSDLDIVRMLSEQTGLPHLTEAQVLATALPEAAVVLTLKQAEGWMVCPITLAERRLVVAMRDPRDMALVDQVRFATGVNHVTAVFATQAGILRGIRKLYKGESEEEQAAEDWKGKAWDPDAVPQTPFSDKFTGTREHQFDTADMTNRLLAEAADAAQSAAPQPRSGTTLAMQLGPAMPAVGATFARRYRLEALLGEGGTASVYKATDAELGEPVAIKIFRPTSPAEAETLLARFKLELSLSRLLNHPNVIRLYDLGSDEGWRYLTMELLSGGDMAQLLAGKKAFPLLQGLRYLEQVCAGLQAAHERGVIHRDIKPQNLFVTADGTVKIMDFGIAKKAQSTGVTVVGQVCGTPDFISPEQIKDFSNVTPLADLYALGATAFMMFTGTPPFTRPDLMGQLMAHATEPAPSPRLKNPLIPAELDAAILRLLEKDPARRFPSARDLGAELLKIRRIVEAHERAAGAAS